MLTGFVALRESADCPGKYIQDNEGFLESVAGATVMDKTGVERDCLTAGSTQAFAVRVTVGAETWYLVAKGEQFDLLVK